MKMKTLLLGVTLGLLAVVHSTPISSVTQIPIKTEDEVMREAITDGFLIDHLLLTTESPRRNATVAHPSSDRSLTTTRDDVLEESETHIEASGQPSDTMEGSGLEVTTDNSLVPRFLQPRVEHETTTHLSPTSVLDTEESSSDPSVFLSTMATFSGSGDDVSDVRPTEATSLSTAHKPGLRSGVLSENIEMATASHRLLLRNEAAPPEPEAKGHSTPGWIIIVGFIVGVAALVMLCVAIATRDKWNAPKQAGATMPQTQTSPSNQQRELEMQTFLHSEEPKENGKAAEYTVIPLDELPENYSSH